MSTPARQLSLNAFYAGAGHHESAWRVPGANPERTLDLRAVERVAALAERGLLDAFFLADTQGGGGRFKAFEPFTLLSALAVKTKHIGLIATVHTTYNEPYHVARKFASLDHISNGRAGWNVVTGGTEGGENFNRRNKTEFEERYAISSEFIEIVTRLWDSWEDDAVVQNKDAGTLNDETKIRSIDFVGKHFSVKGPLNLSRPPQGHPVIIQSGSSDQGREHAARWGELIFTAQISYAHARGFYADLKGRLARYDREADEIKIAPGVYFILGRTEEEALANEAELNAFVDVPKAAERLATRLGLDASKLNLDEPLDVKRIKKSAEVNGARSRHDIILDLIQRDKLSLRTLSHRLAGGRGHFHFVGTPLQLADHIEAWFNGLAADAFNLMPSVYHRDFPLFIEQVVPELQRRGLFRTAYTGATLRGNLGLKRPENSLVQSRVLATA